MNGLGEGRRRKKGREGKGKQGKRREGKGREGQRGEHGRRGGEEEGGDGMDNASIRAKEMDRAEGQRKEALTKEETRLCPVSPLFPVPVALFFLSVIFLRWCDAIQRRIGVSFCCLSVSPTDTKHKRRRWQALFLSFVC